MLLLSFSVLFLVFFVHLGFFTARSRMHFMVYFSILKIGSLWKTSRKCGSVSALLLQRRLKYSSVSKLRW